ncbi:DUF6339 family protein [Propioniciclava sinopodophylli]|uniref:DUF6339 family protein n=1 Tax=Propioniciclava sinopodophylli TaxID=1837344 RepID=UPI00248F5AD2|nr:DUF6339 family protein [Propioniciclava sinopodophylli]
MTEPEYILNRNAIDLLSDRLASSETPGDFLAEADAIVRDPANLLPYSAAFALTEDLEPGDEPTNSIKVFEALGVMDRANAADGRLWSYLGLVTCRQYMEERWPLGSVKNWRSRVDSRWLMTRPTRTRLVRHGIARLWWIANLTHDPQLEQELSRDAHDPYACTRWVMANEDRIQAIFEREAGSSPRVMLASVNAMASVDTGSRGALVKRFMKDLTLTLAYRDLSVLTDAQLTEVCSGLVENAFTDGRQ